MISAVVGLQYGDEGKGRFTDFLMKDYDVNIRFNGSSNAGHSVSIDNNNYVVHLMPSGIFSNKHCLVANDCVLDPITFVEEIKYVESKGFKTDKLKLGSCVTLICPFHRELDAFWEENNTLKLGTTKRGVGHAYADRARRTALRLQCAFLSMDEIYAKYCECFGKNNERFIEYYMKKCDLLKSFEEFYNALQQLKPYIVDVTDFMIEHDKENVLFEGAQSTQLDVTWGEYPFVTSSYCLAQNALVSTGVRKEINKVYGVFKVYTTRVGTGPFITAMDIETDEKVRQLGGEFGATTGRPRKCGWLDLVALKRSCILNGVTDLCVVKTDIFNGFNKIKVCVGYKLNGELLNRTPFIHEYKDITPEYMEFDAWDNENSDKLNNFISYIEQYTNVKVTFVSYGKDRNKLIVKDN